MGGATALEDAQFGSDLIGVVGGWALHSAMPAEYAHNGIWLFFPSTRREFMLSISRVSSAPASFSACRSQQKRLLALIGLDPGPFGFHSGRVGELWPWWPPNSNRF